MSVAERVPNELWDEILTYDSKLTGLIVSRLSRRFRAIGTRALYRDILLDNIRSIVLCFKTLSRNDKAAKAVHSLKSSFPVGLHPKIANQLHAFFRLHARALSSLPNLRCLGVLQAHFEDHTYGEFVDFIWDSCCFPQLWEFQAHVPITRKLVEFLHRHKDILRIIGLIPMGTQSVYPDASLGFPLLHTLHCAPDVATWFLPSSRLPQLQAMYLSCCDFHEDDVYPDAIALLKECWALNEWAKILHISRERLDIDVIRHIAAVFAPIKLSAFHVHIILIDDEPLRVTGDQIMEVARHVSQLGQFLAEFHWTVDAPPTDPITAVEDLDTEYAAVSLIGQGCPSLQYCRFPNAYLWHRVSGNIWIPGDCHNLDKNFKAFRWTFEQLHERKYPALSELYQYMEAYLSEYLRFAVGQFRAAEEYEDSARKRVTMDFMQIAQFLNMWFYLEVARHIPSPVFIEAFMETYDQSIYH
ncbi:hypothetical protein Moror_13725 [Moniliophthora roreri MCA 2997]|uniref:F-box domain-containing protein n=2 Tax=Moniliophthora roreri TaxID=221103 RepID=V2YFA0_MONRO|nr:hypothetical protein Moror_13725 [Moniliophthora roreri MCA 2997]KAI3604738.1 hypothetical protein WG66_008221 [Moniliophthora roreri]